MRKPSLERPGLRKPGLRKPDVRKPDVRNIVLFAGLALVALLAGCGAPHPGLSNGSVSACYRAIPAARTVVHDRDAALVSVHRMPADRVRGQLSAEDQLALSRESDTWVCAVAFKGTFGPGQVDLAPPDLTGRYALVVVSSRDLHVLASAVLSQLPHSLGKRTL
jgi:hypothetical protein